MASTTARHRSRARSGKSMAATSTTEKVFRDLLCEGRSLPAETSDPAGARTIDELRKQVKELKAELEGERVKSRELVRDHEKELRTLRDESERKLETTIDSLTVRKDQERAAEVKRAEERLEKQKEGELRLLAKDHADEMRRIQRKLQHEKEDGIRLAVEEERQHYSEEFLHVLPEEEVRSREARLTKELFVLGEQNEQLEEQVKNLTRENRTQIELLRRMKHEYSVEVESVVKQNKIEASREMAQLQLAERIIAEKEHELHEVVAKADQFMMEKEFLEEELATVKTSMNISGVSTDLNQTASNSSPPTRRSVGGTAGVMQRKMEELEGLIKKLEEDKAELKQENASLRKKLVQQQGGVASVTITEAKGSQDNIVKLRKRNADLMTLTKKLDERCTALKLENEQLRKQDSFPQDLEQQVRKAVARQHTRDIQEYMKQIHSKDKELSELKRKLAKFEVASPSRSDSAPELEKKMRSMAMEKLRMEKLIDKLYSKLPDVVEDVGVSNSELEAESHRAEMLTQENASLKSQLEELHHRLSGGEEVDAPPSVKQQLKQLERECESLRESKQVLEHRGNEMEQRCHELSQKLKVSELNVRELEGCGQLEEELHKATLRLKETEERVQQQEQDLQKLSVTLKERDGTIELLQVDKDVLEVKVHKRDSEIYSLRETLKEVQATPTKPDTMDASIQATPTKPDTVDASIQATPTKPCSLEVGVQATPQSQLRIDAAIQTEPHLLHERAKVETTVSGKIEQQSTRSEHPEHTQARSSALTDPVRTKQSRTSAVSEQASTSLLPPQDSSLESEMRGAGVEVHDPYDSSECVAFSDSNPDEVPDSTHSLDSFKSDRLRDDSPRRHHLIDEGQSTKPAVPIASLATTQQLSSTVAERSGTGGREKVNLDLQEEESLSDEQLSNVSESELQQAKQQGSTMMDGQEMGVAGPAPRVFIVKYSYDPSTMSPNLNHDLELPIVAGDYIYVFGETDGDGFYHAQLTTGEEGLVPSNFIEMVDDDGDEEILSPVNPPQKPSRQGRHSQLQDITEEEEELSSGEPLAPPRELELDRQFVEGDGYGVALSWCPPSPLPPSAAGYNVYVNGELMSSVEGADQTSVIISGVPRKQLVKITVHTVSEEGESPAPSKPIVLNPQYPDPPSDVEVSEADKSLLVGWNHRPSLPDGNTATSFAIYINGEKCYQVSSSLSPSSTSQCVEILPKDLKHLDEDLTIDSSVQLTVRAIAGHHESRGSQPILLNRKQVSLLLGQHSQMLGSEESSSSEVSMSSSEEEKKAYSPAKLESEGGHVTTGRDHVAISNDHVMTGVDHVTNGVEEGSQVGQGPFRYYRALYDYDPFYHSPNEEDIEEELAFKAGDIIAAHGDVGEDGFLEGKLRGKVGFAPSNMLEEITDEGELAQIDSLIHSQSSQNGRDRFSAGGDGSVIKMRAVYDYDPAQDSPNSESGSEVELAFTEGDILTVFGKPDEDGFFQAELGGKRGLVPSNFLEDLKVHRNDGNDGSVEVFAGDEDALKRAEEIIQKASLASMTPDGERNKTSSNILSRGKGLLSSLKDRKNS